MEASATAVTCQPEMITGIAETIAGNAEAIAGNVINHKKSVYAIEHDNWCCNCRYAGNIP